MKVTAGKAAFQPVTITLETVEEVAYMGVLLNIRKGDALKSSQISRKAGEVASRTYMRDQFFDVV